MIQARGFVVMPVRIEKIVFYFNGLSSMTQHINVFITQHSVNFYILGITFTDDEKTKKNM